MSHRLVLSRAAQSSLDDIAAYTVANFGKAQATRYETTLLNACERIANGTAVPRSCRAVIDPRLSPDLQFIRAGEHLIVFLTAGAAITIVDIIHSRSDLPRRIANADPKN